MKRLSFQAIKCGHCTQIESLTNRAAPWRCCQFPALVTVIEHPTLGFVVFDTGYAPAFFDATQNWPERAHRIITPVRLNDDKNLQSQLIKRGINHEDVGAVILSHFHADHLSGIGYFPNAAIFCAKDGLDQINGLSRFGALRRGLIKSLLPEGFENRAQFFTDCPTTTLPKALSPFESGYDLLGDTSLFAIPLPGHACGQYGLAFLDADDRYVFLIADAAWSIDAVMNFHLPARLTNLMLHHGKSYPKTLWALHELSKNAPDTLIIPTHCDTTQKQLVQNV
ncbi:MAG: MBL fold metallo-hydrolase [Paracoccaceae bacterium]|nr:MBL fold metallo-hydrolase [Paracoccaceae bacterium]